MESAAQLQPPPRLRISRQSFATPSGSGARPTDLTSEEDQSAGEDDVSTPRRAPLDIPRLDTPDALGRSEVTPVAETPAARLRALLSRVPNSSTPKAVVPTSPTEFESDFDPPHSSTPGNNTTHASARESLKDLFSRALREPGGTPVKTRGHGRPRRNSIGSSGLEESPRKARVKRISMSDEEGDKIKNDGAESSRGSFRSSQAAATFDSLRARLEVSHVEEKSVAGSSRSSQAATFDALRARLSDNAVLPAAIQRGYSTMETMDIDASMESQPQLRDISLPSGSTSPPAATSTPLRQSVSQFPSQFGGSDLLGEDSDMQRHIGAVGNDTTGDEFFPRQRAISTPHRHSPSHLASSSSVRTVVRPTPVNRRPLSRHSSVGSIDEVLSGASSSQSAADYKERVKEYEQERIKEREKAWNRPSSAGLSRHGSGSRSPSLMRSLTRRGSSASLLSDDGNGRHSPANSIGSQSDAMDQGATRRGEHGLTRQNLQRANSAHAAAATHSPQGERSRTMSQPTRPSSALSRLVPGSPTQRERPTSSLSLHRTSSSLHLYRTASGAASPTSSLASHDSTPEIEHEKQHELERNWNSPLPKWELNPERSFDSENYPHRGASPSPHVHHHRRERRTSLLGESSKDSVGGESHRHSITGGTLLERASSLTSIGNGKMPANATQEKLVRPHSPLPPSPSQTPASPNKTPASRFGWTFPRGKSPLPPLDPHDLPSGASPAPAHGHHRMPSSPTPKSGTRPSSSLGSASPPSHIPVRTRKLSETTPTSPGVDSRKGHKRSTTELAESFGRIPPRITFSTLDAGSDTGASGLDSGHDEADATTPTIPAGPTVASLTQSLAEPSGSRQGQTSPPPNTPVHEEGNHFQATSPLPPAFSPPPSPPPPHLEPAVSTPKRQSSMTSMKLEFKTPSPPRGLPALPGPPSSEDEEDSDRTPVRTPNGDHASHADRLVALKTPRPPGAWGTPYTTPMPDRAISMPPPESNFSELHSVPPDTPPSSLSRATSLPLQTPAPPGAWMATPSTSRRKLLRVRFDDEPSVRKDSSILEKTAANTAANAGLAFRDDTASTSFAVTDPGTPTPPPPSTIPERPVTPEMPPSPPRPLSRSPRRNASIRVLDAFGREITASETMPQPQREIKPEPVEVQATSEGTPTRRKTQIRLLDAMGNEQVEEPFPAQSAENAAANTSNIDETPSVALDSKQAKDLLQRTVADLKTGLAEIESDPSQVTLDDARLVRLDELSRKARVERAQIERQIRLSRSSEELRNGAAATMESRSSARPRLALIRNSPWFWAFVALQIGIIVVLYRQSQREARRMFLTTYYNPLEAELYHHVTRPELLRMSMVDSQWPTSLPSSDQSGFRELAVAVWSALFGSSSLQVGSCETCAGSRGTDSFTVVVT